jgi:CubicO group peptidase (beta-lactamase class C family)
MPDLARFYKALFEGLIFENVRTLPTMLTSVIPRRGGPFSELSGIGHRQYCMGVAASQYRGVTIFMHGGFWGTRGGYVPALNLAFGIAVNQERSRAQQGQLMEVLLDTIIDGQ